MTKATHIVQAIRCKCSYQHHIQKIISRSNNNSTNNIIIRSNIQQYPIIRYYHSILHQSSSTLTSKAIIDDEYKKKYDANKNNNDNNNNKSSLLFYNYNRSFSTTEKRNEMNHEQNTKNEDSNNNKNNDDIIIETKDKESLNILGANPQPNPPEVQKKLESKYRKISLAMAIPEVWDQYKMTWDGFFDNHNKQKIKKEDEEEGNNNYDYKDFIDEEELTRKQRDIRKNIKRNVKVLREEGGHALEKAKTITGIRNKNDLVEFSMEQLKLANECVGEFMNGYRKSRDDEIDKMMNQYFQEEGDKTQMNVLGSQHSKEGFKSGRRKRRRKSKW